MKKLLLGVSAMSAVIFAIMGAQSAGTFHRDIDLFDVIFLYGIWSVLCIIVSSIVASNNQKLSPWLVSLGPMVGAVFAFSAALTTGTLAICLFTGWILALVTAGHLYATIKAD